LQACGAPPYSEKCPREWWHYLWPAGLNVYKCVSW
jgi:hypothetical protein